MSSIRPLATVTVLIGVGVVLWMKINETEPVLPDEIGDWPIGAELEVGSGSEASGYAASVAPDFAASEAPAYDGAEAPAYTPGPAPSYRAAENPGDAAPAWNPETAPSDDQPVATPRDANALPPMPGIPPLDDDGENQPAPSGLASQNPVDVATPVAPGAPESPESTAPPADAAQAENASSVTPTPQTSVYAAARIAVQSALDRGQLARALLLLSDWYDDDSLAPEQKQEVKTLLSQLAGTVIYSREPRLEPPYLVQAGETLDDIAAKYEVPAALLAKINGLDRSTPLEAGTQLKVLKGPFSAIVDISDRELRLMLNQRYAGRFDIEIEPDCSVEDGQWVVDQKPLSPSGGYGASEGVARSLVLANPAAGGGLVAVVRSAGSAGDIAAEPRHRMIRLKASEINDVFDILSVGSRVTIRR